VRRTFVSLFAVASTLLLSGVIPLADEGKMFFELSPDQPLAYLQQGELILLERSDARDTELGVELLVRAVFWGSLKNDFDTASTACIALTELVQDQSVRRDLWDMALIFDQSREGEWARARETQDMESMEIDRLAIGCVYAIRYHQQPNGSELWSQSKVQERVLLAGKQVGIERAQLKELFEREIELGLEDSCRGRLYIADRGTPGQRIACPDHLRGLGMCSNDADLRAMLRIEMVLNGVEIDSWGASMAMSDVGAVKLPSVADLVKMFQVEPAKAFYRDGQWVTTP
jgi:hypothetical protein